MEQYVRILTPTDRHLVPNPEQIVDSAKTMIGQFRFRLTGNPRARSGIAVVKPSTRVHTYRNRFTGENISRSESDFAVIDELDRISAFVQGLQEWTVFFIGEWNPESIGFRFIGPNGSLFEKPICCDVSFHLVPQSNSIIEGGVRFWIEFAFGKFLTPEASQKPVSMNPALVRSFDGCFGTRFSEGFRAD